MQARWILQDTTRAYVFMGIVALALAVVMLGPAFWITRAHLGWREIVGCLLWAALSGWYGGPLLLNLLNHTADAAAQSVEVKVLGSGGRQLVQLGVVSGGATGNDGRGPDGVVFTYDEGDPRARSRPWQDDAPRGSGLAGGSGLSGSSLDRGGRLARRRAPRQFRPRSVGRIGRAGAYADVVQPERLLAFASAFAAAWTADFVFLDGARRHPCAYFGDNGPFPHGSRRRDEW